MRRCQSVSAFRYRVRSFRATFDRPPRTHKPRRLRAANVDAQRQVRNPKRRDELRFSNSRPESSPSIVRWGLFRWHNPSPRFLRSKHVVCKDSSARRYGYHTSVVLLSKLFSLISKMKIIILLSTLTFFISPCPAISSPRLCSDWLLLFESQNFRSVFARLDL